MLAIESPVLQYFCLHIIEEIVKNSSHILSSDNVCVCVCLFVDAAIEWWI
jgi:hypothetical protein